MPPAIDIGSVEAVDVAAVVEDMDDDREDNCFVREAVGSSVPVNVARVGMELED